MENYISKHIHQLQTPSLVFRKPVLDRNAKNMIERAKSFGVSLRPHIKTTKCAEAAVIQTGGTKRCVVASTIPEVEMLCSAGFDDILYGVPFSVAKIQRCACLNVKLTDFSVLIDQDEIVSDLEKYGLCNGKKWSVFVEIDANNNRSGIQYNSDNTLQLIKRIIKSTFINFKGLYCHCGNSYGADSLEHVYTVATDTTNAVLELVEKLKSLDIVCPTYGIGSTPSCSNPAPIMAQLTEWHPGNYILYDVMQMRFGSCSHDDMASFVLTRVIGHYPHYNSIIIDCGFTALSLHGGGDCYGKTPGSGYGVIADHPELKLYEMSQEHGRIKLKDESAEFDFSSFPIGSFLKIYPDHSCATCAMHRIYYVVDRDDVIIDQWKPISGW